MKWYITVLALAIGCDYQDLAPLTSQALGSSQQSQILHLKSKGKGPALFMKTFSHMMNFSGILPKGVEFSWDEQDVQDDIQKADLSLKKAQRYQIYLEKNVLTPDAVRQELLDDEEISQEIFDLAQAQAAQIQQQEQQRNQTELAKLQNVQQQNKPAGAETSGETLHDETPTEGKARKLDYAEELRSRLERSMARDVKGALKKALALLVERIKKEAKATKQTRDIPTDADLWQKIVVEIKKAIIPHIRDVALAAADYKMGMGLGVDMDKVNNRLLQFTRNYVGRWDEWFTPTTQEGLRDAIATWEETGLGKRGLPDLISALEDTLFSETRAERIAATEVTRIFDEANRITEREAGIKKQEWLTARDDIVCTTPIEYGGHTYNGCLDLDGKEFPIDEGPYPPDDTHPNCRCMRTGITEAGEVLTD